MRQERPWMSDASTADLAALSRFTVNIQRLTAPDLNFEQRVASQDAAAVSSSPEALKLQCRQASPCHLLTYSISRVRP